MDAARGRMLLASILMNGLVAAVWAGPVSATDCSLNAPSWGRVGALFAIQGSGFPASASVDVELTIEGGSPDDFTIESDVSGAFEITLTPETIDIGHTTMVATSGASCSAEVQFDIIGENDPAPTAEPGAATAATAPGAPRTDTGVMSANQIGAGQGDWLAFGVVLVIAGFLGLMVGGPIRGRTGR